MASGQPPFFYHILMNPSSPHLPLPTSFVKKHLRNRILKDPILRTANGGYSWKLKMKKFDDDDDGFCFVNGWSKVVKDVGLLFGEFLLFKYVGSGVFLMHVYSVNGCERILVPRSSNFKVDVEVSVEEDDEVVFEDDDVEEDNDDDDDDDMEFGVEEDDEEDDAEEDDEDGVDVELGDDGEDGDDSEDEDEDYVDVDGPDGDPYFVITSSKRNKYKLRFPPDLVPLTKLNTKETITLKNDDGHEKKMSVRSYKQNKSIRYYVAEGWREFQQSNDISEGDECVLKFITSEDKLCLAKVTKKKFRATEVDNDDMDDDEGMDEEGETEDAKEDDSDVDGDDIFDDDVDDEGKGENAKLVNDDEGDEDDDRDVDGNDGNPSFILTSSNKNQYYLWFSADFVALAGINTKKTITLKNLDGYEKELRVKSHRRKHGRKYFLSAGWKEFQRSSNISEGDKFVFKFIISEDKFCLAKITKNKTPARRFPPTAKASVTKVDDGMDDKDVDDNDVTDVELFNDGNPSFVATITPTCNRLLRMPADFARLARLHTKKTLTLKSLDGREKGMPLRVEQTKPARYYLGTGWKDILQSTSISEGDKCVFKFISSEDKLCLAKIIKKKTQARPQLPVVEVEETEINDDDDEDMEDAKDENEDDEPVDDRDPFFVVNINARTKYMLRFPTHLVARTTIQTRETITLKNNDGYEKEMPVRSYKININRSTCYYVAEGWREFQRSNDISEGDECVFKFITSEDKLCLAKVTKKKPRATEVDKEGDSNVDGDDGNPFFKSTSSNKSQYTLWFPTDFVALAGINTKETITIKNLDGYEKELHVRSHRNYKSRQYYLGAGWKEFQRNSNISEGDRFVFKFITSEDKFCLAKIPKKKTPATPQLQVAEAQETEFNVEDDKDENEDVEPVDDRDPFFVVNITTSNKYTLWLPPDFVELARIDGKKNIIIRCLDGKEKHVPLVKQRNSTQYCLSMASPALMRFINISEGDECVFTYIRSEDKICLAKVTKGKTPPTEVDGKDVVVDDNKHPFFVATMNLNNKYMLRLPTAFVASAGIESKENITMKNLDGNETQISIRTDNRHRSTYYRLSVGWHAFKRSNNLSEGDECVFKYITSEDKMCLTKITKKENVDVDHNMDMDEDEYVELGDNGMNVDADDNKDDDKDVERGNDSMDDKDVDEYVKLVDGMEDKNMEFDNNQDEDENENVELVDGMDDKDVDEYVKLQSD